MSKTASATAAVAPQSSDKDEKVSSADIPTGLVEVNARMAAFRKELEAKKAAKKAAAAAADQTESDVETEDVTARLKQNAKRDEARSRGRAPRRSAPATDTSVAKRGYRKRPGTGALQEIRRMQKSTDLLIRKLPFQRLVRELAQEVDPQGELRWQSPAILALQEMSESELIQFLKTPIWRPFTPSA